MIRLIAVEVGLFLVPFVAFALLLVARRRAISVGLLRAEAPIVELTIGGLLLVIVSLVALSSFDRSGPSGTYVPDRFENGRLVPGRVQ